MKRGGAHAHALLLLLTVCAPASAVERIRLTAAELTYSGVTLESVDATMTFRAPARAGLTFQAARARMPKSFAAQTGPIELLQLRCGDLIVREPRLACSDLSMTISARALPPLAFDGSFELRTNPGGLRIKGAGPMLGGNRLHIDFDRAGGVSNVALRLPPTALDTLIPVFAPWVEMPAEAGLVGNAALSVDIVSSRDQSRATIDAKLSGVGFQNAAATWIGEKLDLNLRADVDLAHQPLAWQARLSGDTGQFLGGPVFLDLARNPMAVSANGLFDGGLLAIKDFDSKQENLAHMHGEAQLALAPLSLRNARVEMDSLQFPDAYSTYLQVLLTSTPFNKLETSGRMSGALTLTEGAPVEVDLLADDFAFSDAAREIEVKGVNANLHWTAGETGPPRPSWLKWDSARGWGVTGAASRVDFATHDRSFHLLEEARLPLFDGALVIQRLAVDDAGTPGMSGEFAAVLEPISMKPLSRALGLPEFEGQLSGSIPGLRYRDQLLELEGELKAKVFDGMIVARNLSVRDPLTRFPRMSADISARRLDLDLITRVFDIGNITGRVDMDLQDLETYANRPTAFDFSIRNTPGDRTKRRISQKAVESLSNIGGGGGGGGVARALQNGALRFFDTFIYDEIGLSCQLRNDVCVMGGVGEAPNGFYIVKGFG
ncbi:MAG: hypothetical protein RL030_199, partial [Pseudomonadota bacterium]